MQQKAAISLLLLVFFLSKSNAQEIVSGLQINSAVARMNKSIKIHESKGLNDTLELPFFDDFSMSKVFPSDSLWSDRDVFINNTYPINQLSLGVATFDLLNDQGLIHEDAIKDVFEADKLSSNPINLEGDASDNFFLSFFYQPQGIADAPDINDSLTLQFYSVSDDLWYSVWRSEGEAVHPFKPVIIKIEDPKFTSKGFRFRFTNYGSLASSNEPGMVGNADQWHVDYVYLDRNRNDSDTLLHDVAFSLPLRSVLNNYEAMPWSHFQDWSVSVLKPSVEMHYVNNDNIVRNITRSYSIRDVYEDALVHSFTPLAKNVDPGARETYEALLTFAFNSTSTDSALFEISSTLITDIFDPKVNDTIKYYQEFNNFYAVDDGTSESGYGLNGGGSSNGMAVYRYRSFSADTLRAISICFNDSYQNLNQRLFDLVVLSSDNLTPGDLIYSQEEAMVDPGESINGFVTYHLTDPVPVEGYFFVGWRQRSETWLNAGLDLNTPPLGRQYYYDSGIWFESAVNGSIMLRPIVGAPLLATGIEDIETGINSLDIWPNPATSVLYLNIDHFETRDLRAEIYNTAGKLIRSELINNSIDIADLPEGVYLLLIRRDKQVYSRNKFIKTR